MNYYFEAWKKYAVFNGRARRKEYWIFFLFNILIAVVLGAIEGFTGINSESDESILYSIYQLAILLPSLAVGVRRMHDVNKSGWYILVPVYNLILFCTDGTKGENKYGPDPRVEIEQSEITTIIKDKTESIFCYKCGEALELGSKFCSKCGTKMVSPPVE